MPTNYYHKLLVTVQWVLVTGYYYRSLITDIVSTPCKGLVKGE